MNYYVYILYSQKFDKYYYGQTQNLEERLKRHNAGSEKYTKTYLPWVLFAWKICNTRADAIMMERKLKNLKSIFRMHNFILLHNFQIGRGPEK